MRNKGNVSCLLRWFCGAVLCTAAALALTVPQSAVAQEQKRVIKVGCFPYEEQLVVDAFGNYSGYGYDYLKQIANYTGWDYEFVDASWDECLTMLEEGEIDLLGAVMRSPKRENIYDFSDDPMLSGYGVLATPLDSEALPFEDFKTFDGLKVGVLKGNQQRDVFLEYSRSRGFTPDIQEYDTQAEMDEALSSGKIKAVVMTNILHSSTLRIAATFGENYSYFATTKGNKEVLKALNDAMRQIRLEDPYFNSRLDEKYYGFQTSTTISFTQEELEFIKNCPIIPCTYIPAAAPLSYYDETTKTVQGVAVDVFGLLEEKTGLSFQWLHPASADKAVEMLRSKEALLLSSESDDFAQIETNNAVLTTPYIKNQLVMITNGQDNAGVTVAAYNQGTQNRLVANDVSKGAVIKQYDNVIGCMDAVLNGDATLTYINSTIASYLVNNPKYAGLHTTPCYGYAADLSIAVSKEANPLLLSVLNKGLRGISTTTVNQLVLSQMKKDQAGPIATYLYLHPIETTTLVGGTFFALLLVLLVLLYIRIKSNTKLQRALYTDPLTGYSNYRALSKNAAKLIGQNPQEYALIYLDIHRFKVINDKFGYDTGDKVLVATSDTLQGFLEDREQMARVHADIFVLLLRYASQEALQERLEKLSLCLSQISIDGSDLIKMLFRGGVYPLPQDFDNLDKACDRANYAKDSIDRHFSNLFVFYTDVMHGKALAEKELENSMTAALERGEFFPFYQPKVDAITEKVVGAEALVRWQHPQKGIIFPGDFLPFYEKNGFIVRIDLSIFEQVCRDIQRWLKKGNQGVPVSVNFSRRHILNKELPHKLKEIADSYQIPAQLLEVEITETEELEDVGVSIDFVEALKAYGFSVSIDDYGTGYSSISFLQQLPLDALKLDRQFIINATKSTKAKDIMLHLVASMKKNGIRIICEGVETAEQREFVISLNCRIIQGYFYSKPLKREEFEEFLQKHGVDFTDDLEFVPITKFEKNSWNNTGDFFTRAMPSWIVSCYVDLGYPVYYISPGFLEGLGYSELEFMMASNGKYVNLIHPDDLATTLEQLEQQAARDQDISLQYRLRKKDGDYLWIRELSRFIVADGGRKALLSTCTDVTDIVTLQLEKNRLIETIPAGICELLLTKEGLMIQQAAERFYGIIAYSQEEIANCGNNLCSIIYRQDLTETMNNLKHICEAQLPYWECTFRIHHPDNSLHWITFRGTVFHSVAKPQSTVLVYDSDEEIKTRQAAESARIKLELALNLTGQAIFEYDIKTRTIYSHSGFSAYGFADGITIDVTNGLLKSKVIHPQDMEKVQNMEQQISSGAKRLSTEIRVRERQAEPDSPYIWVSLALSTVFDEDRQPERVVGSVENINQQKRFEESFYQEAQYRKAFTESSLMAYELNLTKDKILRITGSRGFRLKELCEHLENPGQYSTLLSAAVGPLVAPEHRQTVVQELSRESLLALYKNGIFEKSLEYRRLTPEGQSLWNEVLVYLLLDQLSGDVMGYVYHRDIHQRKELKD